MLLLNLFLIATLSLLRASCIRFYYFHNETYAPSVDDDVNNSLEWLPDVSIVLEDPRGFFHDLGSLIDNPVELVEGCEHPTFAVPLPPFYGTEWRDREAFMCIRLWNPYIILIFRDELESTQVHTWPAQTGSPYPRRFQSDLPWQVNADICADQSKPKLEMPVLPYNEPFDWQSYNRLRQMRRRNAGGTDPDPPSTVDQGPVRAIYSLSMLIVACDDMDVAYRPRVKLLGPPPDRGDAGFIRYF
ncbi:hypothetical protein DL770_007235 [Monosporascus sp. CRB-9-2]|nr:hypothetical protein DL770_007235 [Monosporascus sp. CRB-9-2]